jgi:hypothetical protein
MSTVSFGYSNSQNGIFKISELKMSKIFANYGGEKMANNKNWFGMAVMALVFGVILTGCATNVASGKRPELDRKPIGTETHDYTILGTVKLEKNWFGILGFTLNAATFNAYIYQQGGVTYADLLDEARKEFPDADAVIDIKVDYEGSTYALFYARRKNIMTGIAVKYVKEPKPDNPAMDIRLR